MTFKRYIRTLSLGGLAFMVLAVSFILLIDPYGIFGTPRIEGINLAKPFAGNRGRLSKVYQVERVRPASLIVGNSRPEMGLDPTHRCWSQAARPVYNMALPGTSVYAQVRYGQHGLASGPVRQMLVGLDFIDFLVDPQTPSDPEQWPIPSREPDPLAVDALGRTVPEFKWRRLKDYAMAALSLDALGHAIATLAQQRQPFVETRTELGFNPAEQIYRPIVDSEGVSVLFAQKNREVAERLTARSWSLYPRGRTWSSDFEALRRLLRQAREQQIQVTLFINPYHAEYLAAISAFDLWPLFEQWKRRLVALAADEGGLPLWDFSAIDAYSSEPVAGIAARGESLKWFWEPAHYRKELGDKMLDSLLRDQCPAPVATESFGRSLTPSNIDAHLAERAREMTAYARENPSILSRLKAYVPVP
ncbi:hypothetical protein JCM17960_01330 [Magnetospira thiophila]